MLCRNVNRQKSTIKNNKMVSIFFKNNLENWERKPKYTVYSKLFAICSCEWNR